jgi:phage tail sheath protein FI
LPLTNWRQFADTFVPPENGYLGYAVQGFFANGGAECHVVTLEGTPADSPEKVSHALEHALAGLERQEGIDLLCAPDLMTVLQQRGGPAAVPGLQALLLRHAAKMGHRFVILDSLPEANVEEELLHCDALYDAFSDYQVGSEDTSNAALYYPWLKAPPVAGTGPSLATPSGESQETFWTPPCGYVAGVYARTDAAAGIQKAPANEVVEGVLDVRAAITDTDQQAFFQADPPGVVNCVRAFPGRGIRIWGARTLSRDPAWRYVNVRRLFISAVNWMERNMADIPFEPNRPELWSRVERELNAYCFDLFQRGALQGGSTRDAFYVRCDESTNPPESTDAGMIVAEVGLAAAGPHEFVIVRLIRKAGGVSIAGPSWTGTA